MYIYIYINIAPLRIFKINLHPIPLTQQGWSPKVVEMDFRRQPIFLLSKMNFSFRRCFFVSSTYHLYPCSSDIEPSDISLQANAAKCFQIFFIYPGVRAN